MARKTKLIFPGERPFSACPPNFDCNTYRELRINEFTTARAYWEHKVDCLERRLQHAREQVEVQTHRETVRRGRLQKTIAEAQQELSQIG